MQKCKELSRLTKAPGLSSLLFRKQSPASSSAIQPLQETAVVLDPGHPGVAFPRKHLPRFYHNVLSVTATPFGLLQPESVPCQPPFDVAIESWVERISRSLTESTTTQPTLAPVHLPKFQKRGRLSMSLVTVAGKKATSKKKVVRLRIINKIKSALYLAVIRAAVVENGKLSLDKVSPRSDLICQGWTYTVYPNLEIYRMPFSELIPVILDALHAIQKRARELETRWAQKYLRGRNLKPPHNIPPPSKLEITLPVEKSLDPYDHRNSSLSTLSNTTMKEYEIPPTASSDAKASSRSSEIYYPPEPQPITQRPLPQATSQIELDQSFPQIDDGPRTSHAHEDGENPDLNRLLSLLDSTPVGKRKSKSNKSSRAHSEHDKHNHSKRCSSSQFAAFEDSLRNHPSRESLIGATTKGKLFRSRPVVNPDAGKEENRSTGIMHRDQQKREIKPSEYRRK
ncbi:hypothetical protein F5880DRAFT_1610048 [Lentinula raphanica]|nr:hypothetical protein F5880DRAFT_1610048 [Lentinula raphanica]